MFDRTLNAPAKPLSGFNRLSSLVNQRIALLLASGCFLVALSQKAYAAIDAAGNQFSINVDYFSGFSPYISSVLKSQFLAETNWLVIYKFEFTLAIFLLLSIVVLSLLLICRQIKQQITERFANIDNMQQHSGVPVQFPIKKVLLIGLFFVLGLLVFYLHMLLTYQYYTDQRYVQWMSAGFFVFVLYGGYLFGILKRSKQLENVINKLQTQITDKKNVQNKLLESEQRLQRQSASLAYLASMQLSNWQSPEAIFREIAQVSAVALDVERVSVWQFGKNNKQLECLGLYIKSQHLHTVSKPLEAADLPAYFKYLELARVTAINDVYQHPATAEFSADYLQANHIGAMLDGTIWLNGAVIGVICHEHVHGRREWTIDEQNFVGSITDLARLTIEAHKRQQAEDSLSHQQKHLDTIVRKRTASIENNAKLFRFLVERAPVTILYMNIANEIIEMNPEAERISGYSRAYAIGKTYHQLFGTEQNKAQVTRINKQVAFGSKIQGEEITIRCADGSTADLMVSRSMELDDENNPVVISIGYDMSKQKALEVNTQKLLESEKRYRYVVEHAPMPIIIIDEEGRIIEANPEAVLSGGYSLESMIGQQFIQLLVAKESRKIAIASAARAMKGEDFRAVELVLQNAAGEKYEYQCSLGAVMRNSGKQGQLVAIAVDISRQKTLQATLIKARESAESADRIKSMFVASMSHELRTPLNSIIGFLGVVLQGMSGELNLKQKDQLSRAYHSAKHLLSLITDVIDISKIEAGFLQVHIEAFELLPLLYEIEQSVQHIVHEKHLVIKMDCAKGLHLETDRKRLFQVVLNVVSNAVKYTEKGFVHLHAYLEGEQLILTVTDTGIGIADRDLAQLFKPFERIDSPLKIKTLGTGLGLYLTRKILSQLLNGTIAVQTKLGAGSTFSIQIPAKLNPITLPQPPSILEENPTQETLIQKTQIEKTPS